MRNLYYLIFFLIFSACKQEIGWEQIPHLNGYWEIEKVSFPNGSEKIYTVNTTIDYIEVTDKKGYRKKVQPTFLGTYDTSNDAEYFTLIEKNGSIDMYYKNQLSEWGEKIISLDENNFSTVNKEQITYHYKRFTPINLD
ncbi:hypothetical protein [Arenibacter certesii]|uniref:Lipocalin-like domain-containing protein n=1 Tax=Arenibacter certesii TaxID=228955 RepID=A0A918IUH6_9FLAO|nr:hypothetical protein [Arenibacter certesii]GGW31122.1 hypothetical protein GCM10007383_15460 [Arenibacter certesii]